MLQITGLTAKAPDGTVVLDDVSFSLERGWVVAVVGPTGAGKTSLLNALTGRLPAVAGTIRLNGSDVLAGEDVIQRHIGFVPQDDVLHPQLDLRRTLAYAASLRLPPDVGAAGRASRIDAVLAELGLTACADQAVSTLSGGQRKRASVAVELVGEPDVLVLDEPTAGLDPGYEKSVLAILRQLADSGRTVLTVTHSLQALAICDRVLFLAPGGRVAFFGPPSEARAYFDGAEPADVFLALHTEPSQTWKERFRSHPHYARYVGHLGAAVTVRRRAVEPVAEIPMRPCWRSQLSILLRRYVDLIRADRRLVALHAVQGPLLGLLLLGVLRPGSLARSEAGTATVALFLAVSVTWIGTAAASREIVKEQHIFRQERGTGQSVSAYVGSKVLALSALTILESALLILIACARQGPPASGAVLGSGLAELIVAGALVGVAAVAFGLLLSAAVKSADKALTILPIALVSQLVLSGSWVSAQGTPGLRQLRSLTGAHWGAQLIQATVTGDSHEWLYAVSALLTLTFAALAGTVVLVHRRVRPARVVVPMGQRTLELLPRLAPAVVAVLIVGTAGAGSWALVDGPATHSPAQPVTAAALSAPTTPAVPTPAVPTPTVPTPAVPRAAVPRATAPQLELLPVPAASAPPTTAVAGGDRTAATGRDETPVQGVVDTVTGVLDGVAAPVTDSVDAVVEPTTAPPAAVARPPADPAPTLEALMDLAFRLYKVSAAADDARGRTANR